MTLYYSGIGSRATPPEVLSLMRKVARRNAELGLVLRSGHAVGADRAFEEGAGGKAEIFLPWRAYGQKPYKDDPGAPVLGEKVTDDLPEAYELAATLHPAWESCSDGAKRLHARNTQQVLGRDLKTPSLFVCCWTPDGAETEADCTRETGGTGTAIRLASHHGIPVFNLLRPDALARLRDCLERAGVKVRPGGVRKEET